MCISNGHHIQAYPKFQGQKNSRNQTKVVDPSLNKGRPFKSNLGCKQRADVLKKFLSPSPSYITKLILEGKKVNSNKKRGKSRERKANGRAITVSVLYKATHTEHPFSLMLR